MSLDEYKSQLADIELLLADSPEDESLLKLKNDMVELIQLTEEQEGRGGEGEGCDGEANSEEAEDEGNNQIEDTSDAPSVNESAPLSVGLDKDISVPATAAASNNGMESKATASVAKQKMSLKKSKKILDKTFEIPEHLIPLDSDTDAEKKRKKRAARALKAQFKATQKTVESEVKQQSWQDFNKKKKKKRKGGHGESIFKTEDGVDARTGVITGSNSGKQSNMTKKQRHLF